MADLNKIFAELQVNLDKKVDQSKKDQVVLAQEMPLIELGETKVNFGKKHLGETFRKTAEDSEYLQWVKTHVKPESSTEGMKMFIVYLARKTKAEVEKMEEIQSRGVSSGQENLLMAANTKKRVNAEESRHGGFTMPEVEKVSEIDEWSEVGNMGLTKENVEIQQLQETTRHLAERMGRMESILEQIARKMT